MYSVCFPVLNLTGWARLHSLNKACHIALCNGMPVMMVEEPNDGFSP